MPLSHLNFNLPVRTGFLSVVVPCHRSDYGLENCLAALSRQTLNRDLYEIIVANHGKDPQINDLCRKYGARTVALDFRHGSYWARNKALEVTQGEWLGFTDANKIPASDWCEKGIYALGTTQQIIAGDIEILPHPARGYDLAYWVQLFQSFPIESFVKDSNFGVTGNLFLHRHTIEEIGSFDEDLISCGDVQFCQKAKSHGISTIFNRDLKVYHQARSRTELRIKELRIFYGMLQCWSKTNTASRWKWINVFNLLLPPMRISAKPYLKVNLTVFSKIRVYLEITKKRWAQALRICRYKVFKYTPRQNWYELNPSIHSRKQAIPQPK